MNQEIKNNKQYSLKKILGLWAIFSLPPGITYWFLFFSFPKGADFNIAIATLIHTIASYVWLLAVSLFVVKKEEGDIKWQTLKRRLWLQAPSDPKTHKKKKILWLWIIPLILFFALTSLFPFFQSVNDWWINILPIKDPVDMEAFFSNPAVQTTLSGAWWFFGLWLLSGIFNMSEEVVFRGILLPKMNGVFGKADWIANGFLFAIYHIDKPWTWPSMFLYDSVAFALPAKKFKSILVSMAVHFSQIIYALVLMASLIFR